MGRQLHDIRRPPRRGSPGRFRCRGRLIDVIVLRVPRLAKRDVQQNLDEAHSSIGPPESAGCLRHLLAPLPRCEDWPQGKAQLPGIGSFPNQCHSGSSLLEMQRIVLLLIAGRRHQRHQDGRLAQGRQLRDGARAAACDDNGREGETSGNSGPTNPSTQYRPRSSTGRLSANCRD